MEDSKAKAKNLVKSSLPLTYLIIALLALRWTVVEPYVVPTGSMEPTLKPGDRLYALKCAYDVRFPFTEMTLFRTGDVHRGDVILFRAPPDPSVTYVKRAVGLPGDKVEFRDGRLFVNGQEVYRGPAPERGVMYDIDHEKEKTLYVENLTGVKHFMILDSDENSNLRNFGETIIPPGKLLAVGDNRDHSHDSRAWGFVPFENLKGRAMFIWFSSHDWQPRPERIGTLIQ
jgi:signal peptidase I